MSEKEEVIKHLDNFSKIQDMSNVKYVEIAEFDGEKLVLLCEKNFDDKFKFINHDEILAEHNFISEKDKPRIDFEKVKDDRKIFISVFPVFTGVSVTEFIIAESDAAINANSSKLLEFFVNEITLYLEQSKACDPSNNKYKIQLMKLREMQAKLFPSFENIGNFDIKSAYLPSDLMGGNFIDGFFLNENLYQIVICDVGSYDATSSFTGATIRSMIRSHSAGKAIPSSIVYSVTSKLQKLLKESMEPINFVVMQLNLKTSEINLSSYGSLNILYFISGKKAVTNLNTTEIGKQLAKKVDPKDIKIRIDANDSIMFFSHGVKNATSANGRERFGELSIIKEYVTFLNEPSIKITQNMIEKIYTFTDFAPLEEDIIILSVKKQKSV